MADIRITGGCQCGAVRYALHAVPAKPCICHCRMCQKQFGNYFGSFAGVAADDFELTRGEPGVFRSSDIGERLFCARCGTPLGYRSVDTGRVSVAGGSLDEPAAIKPVAQYGIESRVAWLAEIMELPATVTGEGDADPEYRSASRIHARTHPDHDTDEWPASS